eukprot:COSAG03_NODE_18865_length_346_cov_1.251012_1_plen_64_part_10
MSIAPLRFYVETCPTTVSSACPFAAVGFDSPTVKRIEYAQAPHSCEFRLYTTTPVWLLVASNDV